MSDDVEIVVVVVDEPVPAEEVLEPVPAVPVPVVVVPVPVVVVPVPVLVPVPTPVPVPVPEAGGSAGGSLGVRYDSGAAKGMSVDAWLNVAITVPPASMNCPVLGRKTTGCA